MSMHGNPYFTVPTTYVHFNPYFTVPTHHAQSRSDHADVEERELAALEDDELVLVARSGCRGQARQ